MAGALGLVITTNVAVEGRHAIPVYVDDSLPIVGPSRACVIADGSTIPFAGGAPVAVRLAPAGTPAIGPAIPVYVVPGGGSLALPASSRLLTFYDDFTALTLDATKWNTFPQFNANGGGGANSNELEAYVSSALSLNGSRLRITAQHVGSPVLGLNYTSGLIDTFNHFSQVYGRFEARVQLSNVNAAWPAIWMEPITNGADNWIPEIDIMEAYGQAPTAPFQSYHYDDGTPHAPSSTFTGPDFSAAYHIFAIEWESNCISYFIDGVLRFQEFAGLDVNPQPQYLILNMAVGGASGTPVIADFPAFYDIDYVAAYQVETPPTGLPKFDTISDTFAGGSPAAIWTSVADLGSTIAQASNQLICTPKPNAERQNLYTYYETRSRYTLVNSAVFVHVAQASSFFSGPVETILMLADHIYKYQLLMYVTANQLRMRYFSLGVETNVVTLTYNSTTHAWWRIHESGGTIFWDTSTNGTAWTNRASVANPFAVTALLCQIGVLTYDNTGTPSPTTSIFDHFNTT